MPRRGGRRKVGDHGSDHNDDGNRMVAALTVTAKNDEGSEETRRGVDSTGFSLLAKEKNLTGVCFNRESLLQFNDTGFFVVMDRRVEPRLPPLFWGHSRDYQGVADAPTSP